MSKTAADAVAASHETDTPRQMSRMHQSHGQLYVRPRHGEPGSAADTQAVVGAVWIVYWYLFLPAPPETTEVLANASSLPAGYAIHADMASVAAAQRINDTWKYRSESSLSVDQHLVAVLHRPVGRHSTRGVGAAGGMDAHIRQRRHRHDVC